LSLPSESLRDWQQVVAPRFHELPPPVDALPQERGAWLPTVSFSFDGPLRLDGGGRERWGGYETTGLLPYVDEFVDAATGSGEPFCLFVASHMPHHGGAIPGGRVTQRVLT